MINITKEMLDKQYNKQKMLLSSCWIVTVAVWVLTEILFLTAFADADAELRLLIRLALIFFPFLYIGRVSKKIIPSGNGKAVKQAFKVLQRDFMSDNTVNVLSGSIARTAQYADKIKLMQLLADVYHFRGEQAKALELLYSIDRSGFEKYPDLGMSFYGDIIGIYSDLEDRGSVLRAYADAERFIDAAAERNYICCRTAASIMVCVEKARENYKKALEIKLFMNDNMNLFNSSEGASQRGTPLNVFLRGNIFAETAELFYYCGDCRNAEKYLEIGRPMLSASPYMAGKADELLAKIKTATEAKQ